MGGSCTPIHVRNGDVSACRIFCSGVELRSGAPFGWRVRAGLAAVWRVQLLVFLGSSSPRWRCLFADVQSPHLARFLFRHDGGGCKLSVGFHRVHPGGGEELCIDHRSKMPLSLLRGCGLLP